MLLYVSQSVSLFVYLSVCLCLSTWSGSPTILAKMWIDGEERNWTHVAIVDGSRQL